MNPLHEDAAELSLIEHGKVILVPIERLAALDTVLGAHPAKQIGYTPS
jgi:hypothetical protein